MGWLSRGRLLGYNSAMGRKQKTGMEEATGIVLGFANLMDALFLRYTGKTVQTLLKESAQRPRELPAGEKTAPAEADIPLADAYAILGLKPGAPLDDAKKHYRNLAFVFHSDRCEPRLRKRIPYSPARSGSLLAQL